MVATGGDYKGSTCTLVCNSRVHRSDADTAFELVQSDPNLEMKHLVYGNETTRQEHYEKMEKYFETSRKDGVMLWFPGHGQQGTGDWIFMDGVITFVDVFELYQRYFMGHILTIVCDCCYSGHWVEKLALKLDEYGIPPCGHRAKAKDLKVKIIASCKKDQKCREKLFVRNGIGIDKYGSLTFARQMDLSDDQTTVYLDTTEIRCTAGVKGTCNIREGMKWRNILEREI